MKISRGEKTEITSWLRSDDKRGLKKLFKLYNSDLETTEDKYYVLFNLTLNNKINNKIEIAKRYIKELKDIMFDDEYENKIKKAKALWLYAELYKDELTKDELLDVYNEVYDNYIHLGEDDENVLGIKESICLLNEDYGEIINIFQICLERQYIDIINSTLREVSKINTDLYNFILNINNNYKNKQNTAINVIF